jgi:hypothetical protein
MSRAFPRARWLCAEARTNQGGETDGNFREQYYIDKSKVFPQKIEREEGKDYSEGAKVYNLATPIKT